MGWVSCQDDNLDTRGETGRIRNSIIPSPSAEKSVEDKEISQPASKSKKPRLRESQWALRRSANSTGKAIGTRLGTRRKKKRRGKRRKKRVLDNIS